MPEQAQCPRLCWPDYGFYGVGRVFGHVPAAQIKDDYYKTRAYGAIAVIQGGPAASEAFEWIESVSLYLDKPSQKDQNGFLETLKGQAPDGVAFALARAANDLSLTLHILRDKESELQKRHAQRDATLYKSQWLCLA